MESIILLPGVNTVGRHCTRHNVRYRESKPIQLVRRHLCRRSSEDFMNTTMKTRVYICKCGTLQIRHLFKEKDFSEVLCSDCNEPMKNLSDREAIQRLYEILFPS